MPFNETKPFDFAWMSQTIHLTIPNRDELALTLPQNISHGKKKQRALLMLHGFSSSAAVFRLIAPSLKHYDNIFIPTLTGHGKSISAFSIAKSKDWLRDAEHAYKTLMEQFKEVDILGLSLGGLLACHLAQVYPVRQLFLLAPALSLKSNLSTLKRLAEGLKYLGFTNTVNRGGRALNPFADELLYRQLPLSTIIELLKFIENFRFKPWETPTHLFLGKYDDVVDSKKVHDILKPLPTLGVNYLAKSNHVLPLDGDYEYIIEQINHHSSK